VTTVQAEIPSAVENQLLLGDSDAALPTLTKGEAVNSNVVQSGDSPVHEWYRFVLSYPPHLVRKYVEKFSLTTGTPPYSPN